MDVNREVEKAKAGAFDRLPVLRRPPHNCSLIHYIRNQRTCAFATIARTDGLQRRRNDGRHRTARSSSHAARCPLALSSALSLLVQDS